jgi:hypothetical protein
MSKAGALEMERKVYQPEMEGGKLFMPSCDFILSQERYFQK